MNNEHHLPSDIDSIAQQLRRAPDAHKGTLGRALLIGGSRGMSGAIALAGMASLRSGAGLVQVATPLSSQAVVASFDPCFLTTALPEDTEGRMNSSSVPLIQQELTSATAAAIGPGLGRSRDLDEVVSTIYHTCKIPLVVDADALNVLAESRGKLDCAQPRILTPHPGEFARMCGISATEVQTDREAAVRNFLEKHAPENGFDELDESRFVVVLKGEKTIVANRDQLLVNETGNPGMATGGTGDVLTGLIAALLAQGVKPFDAARLGVWLHGTAGDLAAVDIGQISMTATDVNSYLPSAFWLLAADDEGIARS